MNRDYDHSDYDYLDVDLSFPLTPGQAADIAPEPTPPPSLGSLFSGAWEDNTLYAALIRMYERPNEYDPNFKVTKKMMDLHFEGIPTQYWESIAESTSEAEFVYRVQSIKSRLKNREDLQAHGWSGTAVTFGAAMLDPAFLVAAPVASAGLLGKAGQVGITTQRALRTKAAMRGLGLSAAVDIPLEGLRQGMDEMAELEHFFFNVAASATLGTGISAFFPRSIGFQKGWKKQLVMERRRIAQQMMRNVDEVGEEIATTIRPRNVDVDVDEVNALSEEALLREAEELGVPTQTQRARDAQAVDTFELRRAADEAGIDTKRVEDGQVTLKTDEELRAELGAVEVEPQPARIQSHAELEDTSLGRRLAGSKANYSGTKLTYGDDVDKSIYAGGKRKADANASQLAHRKYVMEQLGITNEQFEALRKELLAHLRTKPKPRGETLHVSREEIPNIKDFEGTGPQPQPRPSTATTIPARTAETELRPLDDIRDDVVNARQEQVSIDSQARTAMRTALAESGEEARKYINPDWVEELIKPDTPIGWAAQLIYKLLPWMRPLALKAMKSPNERLAQIFSHFVESPLLGQKIDLETVVAINVDNLLHDYRTLRHALERTEGTSAARAFDEQVADALRQGHTLAGKPGEILDAVRTFFKQTAEYAEKSGIPGFEKFVDEIFNYVPREANAFHVSQALSIHGREKVMDMLEGSLRRANQDWDEKKVNAVARGWLKYAEDPDGYTNARVVGRGSEKKLEAVQSALKGTDLTDDEAKELLDLLIPKSNDPHLGMTNKRINFDEGYVHPDKDLKFSDLLENNIEYLMEKHARRLMGSAEITKLTKALGIEPSGTGTVPTMDDIRIWIKKGGEFGDFEDKAIEIIYRNVMGLGMGDIINNPSWRKFTQYASDYNFIVSMGNVGIAQLPEMANSMAANGLKATMQSVPSLRRLYRKAETGKIDDDLFETLQAAFGAGDMRKGGHSQRHRTNESMGLSPGLRGGNKATRAINKLFDVARGVTSGSTGIRVGEYKIPLVPIGIAPIDEALRLGHAKGAFQDWVNKAFKVKNGKVVKDTLWKKSRSRFRDLGLTDKDIDDILKELDKPGVITVGKGFITGKPVKRWNPDNMDIVLRDKLFFALRRDLDRVIQRNKVGNLSPWMMSPTGGLITQFRKFAINATYKQLAYNLKHMDGVALNSFLGTSMLAVIGYMINSHISASKYSGIEREKFLKNAFGEQEFMGMQIPGGKLTIAAIIRSGWSGVLPMHIDPIARMISPEEENLLNPYFRTSGYATSPLLGIPTVANVKTFADSGYEIGRATLHGASGGRLGDEFTENDLRRLFRIVPLRNTLYLNRALEELVELADLPK